MKSISVYQKTFIFLDIGIQKEIISFRLMSAGELTERLLEQTVV